MARAAAVALLAALLAATGAASASAAGGGWSHPFGLSGPATQDMLPAQVTFGANGAATIAYGITNLDSPADSVAWTAGRSASGALTGARRIAHAQEILGLTYDGTRLQLLVGTSPSTYGCCSSTAVIGAVRGGFGPPRTILTGLTGATVGRLVPVPGGVLAAVATARGVWVSQSDKHARLGTARRLSKAGALPEAFDATTLPGDQTLVVWASGAQSETDSGARTIFAARGSATAAPRGARAAITVPAGHWIDELALARGRRLPAVAWVESWFDPAGAFHSRVVVADIGRTIHARPVSSASELASGLAFAADARGDEALAWKSCTTAGGCSVRVALRPVGRQFSAPQPRSSIDPSQSPAVTVGPDGQALLGWIQLGHVIAAAASPHATRFGSARIIAQTPSAADLTLEFGPFRQALAVWTQGTYPQTLTGALYRTP